MLAVLLLVKAVNAVRPVRAVKLPMSRQLARAFLSLGGALPTRPLDAAAAPFTPAHPLGGSLAASPGGSGGLEVLGRGGGAQHLAAQGGASQGGG